MHILITGASSGIGLALLQSYVAKGYNVSVCARNVATLQSNYSNNKQVYVAAVDVSIANQCHTFVQQAIATFGPLHIVINNAGVTMRAPVVEVDVTVLHQLMNTNYWGAVYITKATLPSILQTKGTICSISSIAGYRGLPSRSGYSASKHALQGFMESLRTELTGTGTHIMWVSPGFTASNIRYTALNSKGIAQAENPLDENKIMSAAICAQHIVNAIAKRKRTLVLTTQGKLAVWLNKILPNLADKLVYQHFYKEQHNK